MNYVTKFIVLVAIAVLAVPRAQAQEEEEVPLGEWVKTATVRAGGSQVGFRDWAGGGVNSLALSGAFNGKAEMTSERVKQSHEGRLGLGAVRQGDDDLRKAEDVVFVGTAWEYLGEGFFSEWHPTFAATVRTQLLDGFVYDGAASTKVSGFFAPGYVTQSLGLSRQLRPYLKQRIGVGLKETIVRTEAFRVAYGNDPDQTVRVEAGLESRTDFEKEIATNVVYKSTLGLFASFSDISNPDALWENLVTMKVNDWLNVNFEFVALYDVDVTKKAQLKEVFSVGALFVLL